MYCWVVLSVTMQLAVRHTGASTRFHKSHNLPAVYRMRCLICRYGPSIITNFVLIYHPFHLHYVGLLLFSDDTESKFKVVCQEIHKTTRQSTSTTTKNRRLKGIKLFFKVQSCFKMQQIYLIFAISPVIILINILERTIYTLCLKAKVGISCKTYSTIQQENCYHFMTVFLVYEIYSDTDVIM